MAGPRYIDHDEQKVVIVMTSGPTTAHRCATPFYLGSLLAAMDADVTIFFTMEGVRLVKRGVPESLVAMSGGKPIIEFIREAKQAGVKLAACHPALPGYDMDVDNLIAEIDEISSGGALADMILSCDKVLFF
jgi:predicted peroxiredoxin